ncbi:hypothetical protein ACEYYA_00975 [Paracoccus sp. p3-h83]|uniref:hypothetical protein n=1 Tax=Paracoccus sp. p3-h83 TaxID=3342805 RepID=UPI0035B9141E
MTVMTWARGEAREYGLVLAQPDLSPATDDRVQLRVGAWPTCVVIEAQPRDLSAAPGAPAQPGWAIRLDDAALADLPARAYAASIWRGSAGQMRRVIEAAPRILNIVEVC